MNIELKENEIRNHVKKLEDEILANECLSVTWLGIEISWQPRNKRDGGNILRNKRWGVFNYTDVFTHRELDREKSIAVLCRPIRERVLEAELTDIKYCKMCGKMSVGEKERLKWGNLSYVTKIMTYKYANEQEFQIAHHEWADICLECCQKIIRYAFKGG